MSILDSVMRFKEIERAKKQADIDNIGTTLETISKLKRADQLFEFEKQKLGADMAKSGFVFDGAEGRFKPNEDLMEKLNIDESGTKEIFGIKGGELTSLGEIDADDKVFKLDSGSQNPLDKFDITDEEKLQATVLARKHSGVRGIKTTAPLIAAQMEQGKSLDEIEDNLRFAQQSEEFSGPVRSAAQSILSDTSKAKAQQSMDFLDDLVESGDIDATREQLTKMARDSVGTDEQKNVRGKERTIEFIGEIKEELLQLQGAGINTNIFSGTAEEVAGKVGAVREPRIRKIATKIATAVQTYRRAMSGVAFSVPESEEYKKIFPGVNKTIGFNLANIGALEETMSGDLEKFYQLTMGKGNFNRIFGSDDALQPKGGSSQKIGRFTVEVVE